MFISGEAGSIALLIPIPNVGSATVTFTLEVAVSVGTLRIRPVTAPNSESAGLVVNDVTTGTFIQGQSAALGVDFSTSSAAFVTLLSVTITPTVGSDLQLFAAINFTWIP
jgi:hypothetical protein